MALINCPECNKQISDKAECCPHCGFPIDSISETENKYCVILENTIGNDHFIIRCLEDNCNYSESHSRKLISSMPTVIIRNISLTKAQKLQNELKSLKATSKITTDKNQEKVVINKTENKDILKCPRCGSTQVAIGQRGYSFITGFWGSNKTVNRCGKCGFSWKP